jgi:hypothetical protein
MQMKNIFLVKPSLLPAALGLFALLCLCPAAATAQTWTGTTSDLWTTGTNWTGGTDPNSSSAVVAISSTVNNPVILNANASISTLTMGASTSLDITAGTLSVFGTSISNAGSISLGSLLQLVNNVTLSGAGTLTLAGGQIGTNGNAYTLTNQSTIAGYGTIGSNVGADYPYLSLNNSGTINANSSANTLTIAGNGTAFTNSGTLEATAGGILDIAVPDPLNDSGGKITAAGSGSTVEISSTIEGGTLKTSGGGLMETIGSATLDGSTQGAITLADGSTYTGGSGTTTSLIGTLNLGTSTGSNLALAGNLRLTGNASISGPGSITMAGGQIGTNGNQYALTNASTIQGYGDIGSNAGSDYPYLSLANSGTIDANSSGNTLEIGGSGTSITNTGLFEATNGGTLLLNTTATIVNTGANITANGAGSTVSFDNVTVQGGSLSELNGGVLQTIGTSTLDGSTSGAITLTDGSTYTGATNTTTNLVGTLKLGTSTGSTFDLTGNLRLTGNATVSGPGSITMTGGQIGTNGNQYTLTNTSTIQGYGDIGSNVGSDYPYLSLVNSGTIDANSSGNTLTVGGNGTSLANTGVIEATAGGTLVLSPTNPLDNQNGTVKANGAGSTVEIIDDATIQGGTLTTANGGVIETGSGGATLDGLTNGAITLSDGSTYTAGTTGLTKIVGALTLGTSTGGNLALTGQLQLTGNTTLSGPGVLTLTSTGGNTAGIGTNGNPFTLTNGATIQGAGLIGSNVGSLYDDLSLTNNGTVNATGGTLTIAGNGTTTTNNGTMAVQTGSTLAITDAFSNFNSTTNTLTGGTYNVNGGTFQFNNANIVTNDADIILAGAGSQIVDQSDDNALANFATNAAGGIFQLGAGRSFTTAGTFTNNGSLIVGAGDTFKVGGAGNLTNFSGSQLTGGSYFVSGTLQFGASGTHITTNDANITLSTAGWSMINLGGGNLLTNLATNDSGAKFTVANNASFTTAGAFSNSGTMDVENGGTLTVAGALTNNGTVSTNGNNQGGTANTLTVTGTLTNGVGDTVAIGENNDTSDVANVGILTNSGTVTVGTGATLNLTSAGTDTNTGTITDGGTLSLATTADLDMEKGGKLAVTGNLTNAGSITTNAANDGGSANSITVSGTLTNDHGATLSIGENNDTSDTASVGKLTNAGTVTVGTGATLTLTSGGADSNTGTITVDGALDIKKATTLSGSGTITLDGGDITGLGAGPAVTNSTTISGSGTISDVGLTNNKTIAASGGTLSILPTSAGLTNKGTLSVASGADMVIGTSAGGALTNFLGTTLTGGTYSVTGTMQFGASGATIATNAANITLNGTGSMINFGSGNLLAGFSDNATGGVFKLASGASLTTSGGSFTNAGAFTISTGTTFSIGGSGFNYTQTAGSTTVAGILTSTSLGTVNLDGGTLSGAGTVADNLVDDSILDPGTSAAKTGKLTVSDTYTQDAGGTLNIEINGATAGTKYDQLKVTGDATLGGTLKIDLGSFTPTVGQKFTILTAAAVADQFTTVTGLAINSNEHFTITYNAGSVVLTVVSGPLPASSPSSAPMVTQLFHPTRYGSAVDQGAGGKSAYGLGVYGVKTQFPALASAAGTARVHNTLGTLISPVAAGAGAAGYGGSASVPAPALNSAFGMNHGFNTLAPVIAGVRGAGGYSGIANVPAPVVSSTFGMNHVFNTLAPVIAGVSGAGGYSGIASVPPAFRGSIPGFSPGGMPGFRPMDESAIAGAPSAPMGAGDAGVAGSMGMAGVSASSYNSMAAMNHMRFECGVDLGALRKTSRKRLLRALWAAPDSPDALNIGYVALTTAH